MTDIFASEGDLVRAAWAEGQSLQWSATPRRRDLDDETAGSYRVRRIRNAGGFWHYAAFFEGQRILGAETLEEAKAVAEYHAANRRVA